MVRIACVVAVLLGCQQGFGPLRAVNDEVGATPVLVQPSPPFEVPAPADPVIAIGRGGQHACVVHASGAVDCWGQPKSCRTCYAAAHPIPTYAASTDTSIKTVQLSLSSCRQLGDGRVTCEHTPMPELTGATALGGSGHVGCAIFAKRVMCWTEDKTDVHPIESLTAATDLKLGYDFACAVDAGRVVCWRLDDNKPPVTVIASGAESLGLGEGDRGGYQKAQSNDRRLQASSDYGCAVMLDHTVQCWGANFFGELLDNSVLESASPIGIRL